MKLAEKGRFAPPPRLPVHAQAVSSSLSSWPDVHARTHWQLGDETVIDGADFYVGERELGHIHLQGEAHIAMPGPLRDALIEAGLASPFPWSRAFVAYSIATAPDVAAAKTLFEVAYDRLRGVGIAELLERVAHLPRAPRQRRSGAGHVGRVNARPR